MKSMLKITFDELHIEFGGLLVDLDRGDDIFVMQMHGLHERFDDGGRIFCNLVAIVFLAFFLDRFERKTERRVKTTEFVRIIQEEAQITKSFKSG